MQNIDFETFKSIILDRAKKEEACSIEYTKACKSSNWGELLSIIKDNADWCYRNIGINAEFLSQVPDDILLANGIYVDKQGIEQREGLCLYYGNSKSKHFGNSISIHFDNSTSRHLGNSISRHYGSSISVHLGNSISRHYDSSISKHYVDNTSRHYGNSASEHYGNSTSKHFDNSTSKHFGSSTSRHFDNSTSEHLGNSKSEHHGNSISRYYGNHAYGNVDILRDTSVIYDSAIVRERSSGKVYCKKDAFEISILG